ncbi:MAG: tetratricopeptide repeat protein [Bacteroidetes bacterium]|nr:tetratricopeptide repeat protein [Bacteroidota bacterium]
MIRFGIPSFRIFLILAVILPALSLSPSCDPDQKEKTAQDSTASRLQFLNDKIAKDSSNADLYRERAELYYEARDLDLALTDISKSLRLYPSNVPSLIVLADIYLLSGKPDNSIEALRKAMALEPGNAEATLKLAKLYLILKDYPQTFEIINGAIKQDKINPEAYYIRGIALLETGDTIRAVKDLQTTVSQDQDHYNALIELGDLYAIKKDPVAADYFRSATKVRPDRPEPYYMLGMFYQETEKFDEAIQVYKQIISIDKGFKNAYYNTGYINLVYKRDFPEAIRQFSEAIQIDSTYAEAYYNRGYAYELSGQMAQARKDYQHTLKIAVNYPLAIEGLNRLDKAGISK